MGQEDRCGLAWMVDLVQVLHCGAGRSMWLDLNGWFVTGVALWDRRIDVAWPEWLICYRYIIVGQEDRMGLTWMVDLLQVYHCWTERSMWLDLSGWFVTGISLLDRKIDVAWPEWLSCYRASIVGHNYRWSLTGMARRCRTLVSNWTRQHVMGSLAAALALLLLLSLYWTVSSSLCTSSIPLLQYYPVPIGPQVRNSRLVHSHFATVVNREFSDGQ